ncbi:TRAP transporter small permease [uncultured Ruegeria sp.]|uniref:TRAP transporter small permease n=1 Tax=uncultured Ruegeria sp. TaxID=259304 RepID=UPI0026181E0B|nr:TRAP transporter small permease [uncultured Ruegeria sp.]
MRKILNSLYFGAALLGAFFIVAIGLLIVVQVVGRQLGVQVKGADDLTAWSVVAAGFLPLAYTFRNGRHIRVTLLIDKAGRFKTVMEFAVLAIGLFFTGYLTYSSIDMVWDSIRFDDLTQGLINIPLWIPQASIPIGAMVLAIAILDDLLCLFFGRTPSYVQAAEHNDPADQHLD